MVFSEKKQRLFLLDGLGALLTAFLLSGVLAPHEDVFGMPGTIARLLAAIACLYAVYSACCYFFVRKQQWLFLQLIAAANGLYCLLTAALMVYWHERLTGYGFVYFSVEIAVITAVLIAEYRAAVSMKHKPNDHQ